jgi:transposase
MFGLGPATKVYLAVGPTDLRKGFDGLYGLARDHLGLDPLSGHLALFCNRARTRREDFVLGWPRFVGLRQAVRKGAFQLADAGPGVGLRDVKSGGVCVVDRGH